MHRLVTLLAIAALAGLAQAAEPLRHDVLNLSVSANAEVLRDVLSLSFSTQREGADAAQVQRELQAALNAALSEARKHAKAQELEVRTGNFSVQPRYAPKGGTDGWQGQAELIVEGSDTAAIAALAGTIKTLSISRASYQLSREAREKAEGRLSGEAIERFRARASEYARAFGYGGYAISEVSINLGDLQQQVIVPMQVRSLSVASSNAAPLPTEAGRATVTVSVNGSIIMSK